MKTKLFLLLSVFLLISFVAAQGMICVDFDKPSAPSNLAVTSSGQNIILNWETAIDIPDCSGVDYYVILKNGVIIAEQITSLTYTDSNVPYGTYSYSVYAIDKIAHLGGQAIKNDVILSILTTPTTDSKSSVGSGGGGSSKPKAIINTTVIGGEAESSYVCEENWECGEWGKCINGKQTRICIDNTKCGTEIEIPKTTQTCEEKQSSNFLTGAVTGVGEFATSPGGIATGLGFITILVGSFVFVSLRKKRLSKEK